MAARILSYPCLADGPTLFVNVINPLTNRLQIFQMLVDTGASRTCFPAKRASFLGHDNDHSRVESTTIKGVGGESRAFVHSLRIELVDPDAKFWRTLICPWKSSVIPVLFVDKMDTETGILGRDVLAHWKSTRFRPPLSGKSGQWWVDIEL